MTSGGKRKGAGRPVLPDDERLDYIIRIRVTAAQAAAFKAITEGDDGHDVRDVLLAGIAALIRRRKRRPPR